MEIIRCQISSDDWITIFLLCEWIINQGVWWPLFLVMWILFVARHREVNE